MQGYFERSIPKFGIFLNTISSLTAEAVFRTTILDAVTQYQEIISLVNSAAKRGS